MKKFSLRNRIKKKFHLSDHFIDQIWSYFCFNFVLWIFHLLIVSVISFFHFSLGHNIGTISDWIIDRGWALIIVTKISYAYFVVNFIKLKNRGLPRIASVFRSGKQWPQTEFLVVIFFFFLGYISLGKLQINHDFIFEWQRPLWSILGIFVFFATDLCFLLALDALYPLKSIREKNIRPFVFLCLFYFQSKFIFAYEQNANGKNVMFFYLVLLFSNWRRRNWSLPFLVIFFLIIPLAIFLGADPVWGDIYSFFRLKNPLKDYEFFILISLVSTYLAFKKTMNPEYVYRP